MEFSHIVFSLEFFDQYADFFLTLSANGLHSVMINAMNQFIENYIQKETQLSIYQMYSYGGALLNIFLKWEENGKKDSVQDIARTLSVS